MEIVIALTCLLVVFSSELIIRGLYEADSTERDIYEESNRYYNELKNETENRKRNSNRAK